MKNIKILAAVLALSLTATSCKDYLDINDNPNAVPAEMITPKLLFPGAVAQTWRTQGINMMEYGNLMMNNWAGDVYQFGSPYMNQFTLGSVNSSFYSAIWDNIYLNINNFAAIEKYENSTHLQDKYVVMAKVMKAFYMQYIVDLYGDAPYSQAFQGQADLTPAYDDDKEIYKSLIADLEAASDLVDEIANNPAASTTYENPGAADIVFAGDMTKWKQFANTLKLRMLLRMSETTHADMASYRDAKLATLVGASFLEVDVKENPPYAAGTDATFNPFFLTYRANAAGNAPQAYNLITASEHIATVLNGNKNYAGANTVAPNPAAEYQKFNNIVDPRRAALFTTVIIPGQGFFTKGVRQGTVSGDQGAPVDNKNISRLAANNFSGTGTVNLTTGNRAGMIMSLAETKLLLAEAGVRYPSIFSSGAAELNAAIDASCAWLGVATATVSTYKTAITSVPGLGWTGTDAQKIEAIMTQKWLALVNVNPTEALIEYNRTGYPYTPMAASSIQTRKPYRLVYPTSEYVANSGNVPNMTSADCFTINAKTPFWRQ